MVGSVQWDSSHKELPRFTIYLRRLKISLFIYYEATAVPKRYLMPPRVLLGWVRVDWLRAIWLKALG
ncbi:hypothetical protein GCM10007902_10360 [Dyella nitratireducens]|nr:hypothetical protein GCM10007902_10360 [Dyella nitratireducens]